MRRGPLTRALLGLAVLGTAACGSRGVGNTTDSGASPSCADLPAAHAAALAQAKRCDPDGGRNECQILVKLDLLCGCQTIVNDATVVNAMEREWDNMQCASMPLYTKGTVCSPGCRVEQSAPCIAVDGGVGVCHVEGDPLP